MKQEGLRHMLIVRQMTESDIGQVLSLAVECFGRHAAKTGKSYIESQFTNAGQEREYKPYFYVAEIDNTSSQIVGMLGYCSSWLENGVYEINWTGVANVYRKRKVATLMIDHVLDIISEHADYVRLYTLIPEFWQRWDFWPVAGASMVETTQGRVLMRKQIRKGSVELTTEP
jgi:ribosomal protein S18 acetylase RimI-like enzyme